MTWTCAECSTVYSVGAPRCPQCGSTEYVETHMAKITRHGGPSVATDNRPPANEPEPEPTPEPKPKPSAARRTRTQTRKKD